MSPWDLRGWISKAKTGGLLKVVEGVEPDEIGVMTEVNARNRGPALVFDSVRGFRKGFRVLTGAVNNASLFALTLGLKESVDTRHMIEWLRDKPARWQEESKNYPPVFVDEAPILQNVKSGDQVDLLQFPVPKWHSLDVGPYIGTGSGIITRDDETGWVNVGTYRGQLMGKNEVGLYISPGKHGRIMRDKAFSEKRKMPVVMVFGMEPLLFIFSSSEVPYGVSELNYVGAIRRDRVPVIRGQVTGLPIPAFAEIAVEGFLEPDKVREEGPFGEWTGYYGSGQREEPYLQVERLYYRDDPILLGSPPSKGSYCDYGYFRSVTRSALVYNRLERSGVPGVKGVWCPEFGGSRQWVIVSIEQLYPGHATEVAALASQLRESAYAGKFVVVVDSDVNPYDTDDVLWAVCTRADPASDIDFLRKAWSTPLDPRIERPTDDWTNSRALIRAVKPFDWKDKYPRTAVEDEEKRAAAFEKYKNELNWTCW